MKTLLLDMDGVITSERVYWDSAGLVAAKTLGEKEDVAVARKILPTATIKRIKSFGINSNWDLAYIVSALLSKGVGLQKFIEAMDKTGARGFDYLDILGELAGEEFKEKGQFWDDVLVDFQAYFDKLKKTEEPLLPLDKIKKSLEELKGLKDSKGMNLKLGIVTGRPRDEIMEPLNRWGLTGYFDGPISVFEDVKDAERSLRKKGLEGELLKPHPLPYLLAIVGGKKAMEMTLSGDLELGPAGEDFIILGDSTSDALAAQKMGVKMIGLLTGVSTEADLKKAGCARIAKDLAELPRVLKEIL